MDATTRAELLDCAYMPVEVRTTNASLAIPFSGDLLIGGFIFTETTGAATASLDLIDGSASGGTLLAPVNLLAGGCVHVEIPGKGLVVTSGLFLVVNSGSVRGSIWVTNV